MHTRKEEALCVVVCAKGKVQCVLPFCAKKKATTPQAGGAVVACMTESYIDIVGLRKVKNAVTSTARGSKLRVYAPNKQTTQHAMGFLDDVPLPSGDALLGASAAATIGAGALCLVAPKKLHELYFSDEDGNNKPVR